MTLRALVCCVIASIGMGCPLLGARSIVVADQHDGDQKELRVDGSTLTILPYGNAESWVITATVDGSCRAIVDFNVPNKPSPPPVDLTATFYELSTPASKIAGNDVIIAVGFTDPTATIAATPEYPVNFWIEVPPTSTFLAASH